MEQLGRLLITGSHGFIGSHLCNELSVKDVNFTRFEGNLLNIADIENSMPEGEIDSIIHLAGVYAGDITTQMEGNVNGTANLASVASRRGVRKIIFASTGAVYGNTLGEYSEETDSLAPNSEYGYTKKIAEEILLDYAKFTKLKVLVLRFPNVYGPGSRGVISSFSKSIAEEGLVYLSGNGLQLRNYLHVEDAVTAICKSLDYERTDIFNITNPIKLSLLDVIEHFRKLYQFDVIKRNDGNSLRSLVLDHRKADSLLGFKARYQNLLIN